jgi:hypothetical protein
MRAEIELCRWFVATTTTTTSDDGCWFDSDTFGG